MDASRDTTAASARRLPRFGGTASNALLGTWSAISGIAPHVLHHVGPLAGAAFLAGLGGRLLFAGIALAVSLPLLIRIYRRFGTWVAPAVALAIMAALFSFSTFVIGPAVTGRSDVADPSTNRPIVEEHEQHH